MAFVAGFFAVIMLDINPDAVVAAVIELTRSAPMLCD